jgi:hypothetical protein
LNATIGGLRGPKREARGRDDMDDGDGTAVRAVPIDEEPNR